MKNSVSLKSVLLCTLIGASFMSENVYASSLVEPFPVAVRESTQDYVSQRPEVSKRLFHSKAVEAKIQEVKKLHFLLQFVRVHKIMCHNVRKFQNVYFIRKLLRLRYKR